MPVDRTCPDHDRMPASGPVPSCTCAHGAHEKGPEPFGIEGAPNAAECRFVRADRTTESRIAEAHYRPVEHAPSVESRMRVAVAIRALLETFHVSVSAFARLHDVNEKHVRKWLDGRANYPAWGFDVLGEEMSDWLYARIRSARSGPSRATSPMRRALGWMRREGTMQDILSAQQELASLAMNKAGGGT